MSCLLKNPPAASQLVSKGCVRSVSVQRVLAENAFPPGFRRYVELSPSGLVLVGAEVPSLVLAVSIAALLDQPSIPSLSRAMSTHEPHTHH